MKLIKFQSQLFSNQSGFTLIELMIIVVLIGILASISTPTFIGMMNKNKIDNALVNLQGALKESQRQAIRKSKTCTVNLPTKNIANATLQGTCLGTGKRTLNNVYITYNNTANIKFTHKGEVSPLRTIVLYIPNTNYRRCLVVSNGIGIMRVGTYTDNNLNTLNGNDYCISN